MNVQLDYMHIPHADDTEDITDEDTKSYDRNHSKEWNALVDKRADDLENEMKIEENTKIAKKKAAEEAKRKAIEDKAKMEAEKRKQAQDLANKKTVKERVQTVDFNDIYTGIHPEDIGDVQLGYELHSKFWNKEVDEQAAALEKTMQETETAEERNKQEGTTDALINEKVKTQAEVDADKEPAHHKTVDMEELYNGM